MDSIGHLTAKLEKAQYLLQSYVERDRRRKNEIETLACLLRARTDRVRHLENEIKRLEGNAGLREKFDRQRAIIAELQTKCAKLEQQVNG